MQKRKAQFLRIAFGIALVAAVSLGTAYLFAGTEIRTLLPLLFIVVLVILARYFGMTVAVAGSLLCAVVFARFLFEPTGSLHVEDLVARRNLLWMVVGAVALSYLFAPSSTQHHP